MGLAQRVERKSGIADFADERSYTASWSLEAFSLRTAEDFDEDFCPQLQQMLKHRDMDWNCLPQENYHGCVEYKWRLGAEHHGKVSLLATQMQFRLAEGKGTAFYILGVRDSGTTAGLSQDEHVAAVRVLMAAAVATGSVVLLEAMSHQQQRKCSRRCSVWRVQPRLAAMKSFADLLHHRG